MSDTLSRTRGSPAGQAQEEYRSERARSALDAGRVGVGAVPRGRNEHQLFRYLPQLEARTTRTTSLHRIAMLGNHLPRRCGIATFTTDLSEAIGSEYPALECQVVAMNDPGRRYAYPERVRLEVAAADAASYRLASEFLNAGSVDLLSVQHEYGIFGGNAGSHVLALLSGLRMPIVTTLHTILARPDPQQRLVMEEIARLSERLVVMSTDGARLLGDVYHVPDARIDFIPHGIPSLPDAKRSKKRLGVEGRPVILTFGLLSPDKGIEHVIDAMPAIMERHPDALYIVLGATHPHVREQQGETYRLMLEDRARGLGVDPGIIFHDRFVSQDELNEYLAAADLYITPYLNPEQSTSGTLAYAVGSGKAVISTPYSYAREILSDGRGILVPWPRDDPQAIERAVIGVLDDDEKRASLCARAAAYGRSMLWPEVASAYVRSFERARAEGTDHHHGFSGARTHVERQLVLPRIDLSHLRLMSDCTGVLQHAAFSIPRYEDGYCLDDNARALLLTTLLEDEGIGDIEALRSPASRYLAFVRHALDARTGRFRNFMSYSRQWTDGPGSEDSHGRALWALGSVVGRSHDPGRRSLAGSLFHAALGSVDDFTSPRAWAYALLGIDEYLRKYQDGRQARVARGRLAGRLLDLYRRSCRPDWHWFEDRATYCNARLSQALLLSAWRMGHDEMREAGLRSLHWLAEVQCSPSGEGCFAPIGSNGFYERGGTMAAFDQQPVEASAMVSACLTARRVTGSGPWESHARLAFSWFLGRNQLQQPLYDSATGGCRDGLHADRPNDNQGAESTLSFLIALVEMRSAALTARADTMELNVTENAS